jgi:hypothetical protein
LKLPRLKNPKKLRLRGQSHLANFVEEQHPVRGLLDEAGLGLHGSGESTSFVSEEFGFQKVLRQCRAVQRDKRSPIATCAKP